MKILAASLIAMTGIVALAGTVGEGEETIVDVVGPETVVSGETAGSEESDEVSEPSTGEEETLPVLSAYRQHADTVDSARALALVNLTVDVDKLNSEEYIPGKIEIFDPRCRTVAGEKEVSYTCQMRYRGSSSLAYQKKSFAVKLTDESGEDLDANILGIRKENSWILNAMAVDRMRMRNRVCMDVWGEISKTPYETKYDRRNATKGDFVEVYLNGEYWGLYELSDKIDRKLLNLKKSKVDKKTGLVTNHGVLYKCTSWTYASTLVGYLPSERTDTTIWCSWELKYPEDYPCRQVWLPLMTACNFGAQASSWTGWGNYKTRAAIEEAYRSHFYMENLIDYATLMMLMEIRDATYKNTYMSTPDIEEGRKLLITPWDMDTSLGGEWDGSYYEGSGTLESWIGQNSPFTRMYALDADDMQSKLDSSLKAVSTTILSDTAMQRRLLGIAKRFDESGAWERERAKWNGNPVPLKASAVDETAVAMETLRDVRKRIVPQEETPSEENGEGGNGETGEGGNGENGEGGNGESGEGGNDESGEGGNGESGEGGNGENGESGEGGNGEAGEGGNGENGEGGNGESGEGGNGEAGEGGNGENGEGGNGEGGNGENGEGGNGENGEGGNGENGEGGNGEAGEGGNGGNGENGENGEGGNGEENGEGGNGEAGEGGNGEENRDNGEGGNGENGEGGNGEAGEGGNGEAGEGGNGESGEGGNGENGEGGNGENGGENGEGGNGENGEENGEGGNGENGEENGEGGNGENGEENGEGGNGENGEGGNGENGEGGNGENGEGGNGENGEGGNGESGEGGNGENGEGGNGENGEGGNGENGEGGNGENGEGGNGESGEGGNGESGEGGNGENGEQEGHKTTGKAVIRSGKEGEGREGEEGPIFDLLGRKLRKAPHNRPYIKDRKLIWRRTM